jgi:FixJ family two-component response regulator
VSASPRIVYIVDDDLSVRRGLERLLRAAGYQAETFASAREFLDRAHFNGPRCLLLDVRMPQSGGFELLERLRALGQEIPVIFITGHGDIPMAVRAMKAGAVDFIPKPFDEEHLLEAIAQALARDQARR